MRTHRDHALLYSTMVCLLLAEQQFEYATKYATVEEVDELDNTKEDILEGPSHAFYGMMEAFGIDLSTAEKAMTILRAANININPAFGEVDGMLTISAMAAGALDMATAGETR